MKKYPIWAIGTITFTLCFIITLIIFATRASRVPFDLVAPNYYEQELAYQDRIDAIARVAKLNQKPTITSTKTHITLNLPPTIIAQLTQGTLTLYRPSDASQDITKPIPPNTATLNIPIAEKPKGHWKARLTWQMNNQTHYQETTLLL